MADKAISQLNPATAVTALDLFVLEQSGEAKKLTGQILENWLVSYADGHGGIQSIVKTGSAGTDPVIDTYTITLADETVSTFTVTNGLKGDQGDQTYVWIRYAAHYPTSDADISPSPDDWIGIYSGTSSTAPIHYTDYTWYEFKGEKGDTGEAATIVAQTVGYQQSDSGSIVPEGSWTTTVPAPVQGKFLWTRMQLQFNTGSTITSYSVSRYGMDGSGSVVTVNNVSPDQYGNVQLVANDIQAFDSQSVQTHLTDAETDIADLKTSISNVKADLGIVEDGNTATHAISAGQYVIWKGSLYTANSAIFVGTTLSSSNLTEVSNGGFNDLKNTSGTGYCKMPDGTLICYGTFTTKRADYTMTAYGSLFNGTINPSVLFAQTFVSVPSLIVQAVDNSCPVTYSTASVSGITEMQVMRHVNNGPPDGTNWSYTAIGRWE